MKILILFDIDRPASPDEPLTSQKALREEGKRTEADVLATLKRLGHEADTLGVYDDARSIIDKVDTFKPDVVFNTCESFLSDRAHEPNIPALLELLRVRYTGAGPDALMLCKDKALAKKLLTYHSVRVASFLVSPPDRPLRSLRKFKFPAFVKPASEESSDGISKASMVKTEPEAINRARFIHETFKCDALIEEYVDGREITVGVLGNQRLTTLPPQELFFGNPDDAPADGAPRFATAKAKWDDAYRKKWGIKNGPAGALADGVEKKLTALARRVYRILHIRGLGRIDVRVTPENDIVVMEANPNPSLAKDDDFALAAGRAGIEYDALLQRILENAVR